jgi:hypothetical protein
MSRPHRLDLAIATAAAAGGAVALMLSARSGDLVNAGGALGVVLLLDAAARLALSRLR